MKQKWYKKECSLSTKVMAKTVEAEKKKTRVSQEQIRKFHRKVFSFYQKNKRDLPWRQTTDPYKILLSELMLQQTQVNRVISYYINWIRRWPTIQDLASVKRTEVLKAWMGLGYNTRAVNLHKAAQKIVDSFHGDVLNAMKQFKVIPGVGLYTSQAVLIFSTNTDLVTVDTNIRRIFITEFHLPEKIADKELWELAEQCLPKGKSRDWHNALMDYGALYLTAQKTGIKPKTQQSRFEGSDRQIRARIIRSLLTENMSLSDLEKTLNVERIRLKQILEKMMNEKLIVQKSNVYLLYE
jgi:A/G-specific adenine glycosylase